MYLCTQQSTCSALISRLSHLLLLLVVALLLNDSFNFPQGWIKYIVIVNFLTIATETDLEIIADFLKPVKKEKEKRKTFFMLIQLLK